MIARRNRSPATKTCECIPLPDDQALRLAVVADTHANPHPRLLELVAAAKPAAILHAGDIGDARVIEQLRTIAQVVAVRGNIDQRMASLPDEVVLDLGSSTRPRLRILLLHVGLFGPYLRAEVQRKAKLEAAGLVVCGHSHVPFIGKSRGLSVFNPGSAGPRRFGLPIVFGTLELDARELRLQHVDCETGLIWQPPGRAPEDPQTG